MRSLPIAVLLVATIASVAVAQRNEREHRLMVPKGTDVVLVFDEHLSSKHARVDDTVPLHVRDGVRIDGVTVLEAGTAVTGRVVDVSGPKAFGIGGKLRLALDPIETPYGDRLYLEPQQKGKGIGKRTGDAAAISAGGAILLGPLGLIGGLFVHGKPVNINPGDQLVTEVSRDTLVYWY